jgi:hypothetical protein
MPTNRRPLKRARQPTFDNETISEFARLEGVPDRLRDGDAFQKADYALHSRLGLGEERFCSQVSVFDRDEDHSRPNTPQGEDFRRVRSVRLALIAAAMLRGHKLPTTQPARKSRASASANRRKRCNSDQ